MNRYLREIKQLASDMSNSLTELEASQFTTTRDEKANLIVTFNDGYITQLPLIPFRPYQLEAQVKLYQEGIKRILLERPRRSGKEVESWNLIIEGAIESPGLYLMVYPTNVRARAVLWD